MPANGTVAAKPARPAQPAGGEPADRTAPPALSALFAETDLAALDLLQARTPPDVSAEFLVDAFGLRTPPDLLPELASRLGRVLPRRPLADSRVAGADWVGLAASIAAARGSWRGLSVVTPLTELPLVGLVAARRQGLATDLVATEAHPGRFAALQRHAAANAPDATRHRFLQAAVQVSVAPPRGLAVTGLLGEADAWDWVRIGDPALARQAVIEALPLLAERVRLLALATGSRFGEATCIRVLDKAGWTLVGETPAILRRDAPGRAARFGVQVWRAPPRQG